MKTSMRSESADRTLVVADPACDGRILEDTVEVGRIVVHRLEGGIVLRTIRRRLGRHSKTRHRDDEAASDTGRAVWRQILAFMSPTSTA